MIYEIKERILKIQNGEVPEGYKKTKIGIVPNEWKVKKLNDICDKIKDKVGDEKLETLSITAGKGFVNQAEKFGKELSGKQYKNYTIIQKGDFSYNKGNSKKYPQGCIYLLEDRERAAVPNVFNSFRLNKQNSIFYKYLFVYGFLNQQLYRYINSGVRNDGLLNLYDDDFYSCCILIPSLLEQEKIAEILSTHDKVIELKERLIEEKQKQKKYLMQNLLTGKKRLKGFEENWKEKKVSEIFKITRGNVLSLSLIKDEKKGEYIYPVYSSQTKNNGLLGYYNQFLYKNAITWTTDGANAGNVAYREGDFYCTNVCGVLLDYNGNANKCVAEIINSKTKYYVSYVGNPKLMNNTMGRIKINLPPLEEQTAIANILSIADKEIELLQKELEQEKQKKKSLMQLLLTGIVRVKL